MPSAALHLLGLHHVTAITANAPANHAFYTGVLGMRLVKRTVNQDDTTAYHLFYADGEGRAGTDLTFFDWPTEPARRGTGSVSQTALRVAGPGVLDWWAAHLAAAGTATQSTPGGLAFEDPEGQRLRLLDDGGIGDARPWAHSPVPAAHQIRGLGPATLSVADLAPTEAFLTDVLGMRRDRAVPGGIVLAMGEGGPAAELHLTAEPRAPAARASAGRAPAAREGAGGVHHIAFSIPDAAYGAWVDRYARLGVRSSGPVDRYYFRSLYAREPGGILCEIATEGPGFAADEPLATMGERLSLPPFLEPRRHEIEAGLRPL